MSRVGIIPVPNHLSTSRYATQQNALHPTCHTIQETKHAFPESRRVFYAAAISIFFPLTLFHSHSAPPNKLITATATPT